MRKLKRSECVVLHLVLKGKWFRMIESGEKREEYRATTGYWASRIYPIWNAFNPNKVIVFRLGYSRNAPRLAFLCSDVFITDDSSYPEWGEPSTAHWVLVLGERVELYDQPTPTP